MRPKIPPEYLTYLKEHGVFEGALGDGLPFGESWIQLWPGDEIARWNDEYALDTYADGYIAFASNGGGELFVFDGAGAIHLMPAIGMEPGAALFTATSFAEFASRIRR